MTTTYDPTTTGALAFTSDLLAHGGHGAAFGIHGVSDEDLLGMLSRGVIDSLTKTSHAQADGWYLVGKTKIGDVQFTLFGDTHDDEAEVQEQA